MALCLRSSTTDKTNPTLRYLLIPIRILFQKLTTFDKNVENKELPHIIHVIEKSVQDLHKIEAINISLW